MSQEPYHAPKMPRVDPIPWRESEFEKWFLTNPVLPRGERLCFVGRHRPLRRDVDLVAVDCEGGLVIVEVKNERSTRRAVGQALEYLSQYEEPSLEEIEEEMAELFGRSLSDAFQAEFKRPLSALGARRRVFIVAPSFDVASGVCAKWLTRQLAPKGIEFHLIAAERTEHGFSLSVFEPPPLVHGGKLAKSFGTTVKGRLFYVLDGGTKPMMWHVGRIRDGVLTMLSTATRSKRSLRRSSRYLVPLPEAPWVDLTEQGSVWRSRKESSKHARLLGRVNPDPKLKGGPSWVVYARFRDGSFANYRRLALSKFQRDFERVEATLPDWAACVGQVASISPNRG